VAAVAPVPSGGRSAGRSAGRATTDRRPSLRLAPPLRQRTRAYGDVVFASTLSVVLAVGIIGVLLLNTAMQTQADRIAIAKQRLAALTLQAQVTQTDLDRASTASELAQRVTRLGMRPAGQMGVLRPATRPPVRLPAAPKVAVSARERAATPVPAG
jgi:hypothetical protein